MSQHLKLDPTNYQALALRGEVYYLLGRNDEATKDYEESLRIRPQFEIALVGVSQCYLVHGKFEEAIGILNQLINATPNQPRYIYARGICFEKIGDQESALKDFNRVLHLNPGDPDVLEHLAECKHSQVDIKLTYYVAYRPVATDKEISTEEKRWSVTDKWILIAMYITSYAHQTNCSSAVVAVGYLYYRSRDGDDDD
jgi:tetratricopeptide (TPR) repeat protein